MPVIERNMNMRKAKFTNGVQGKGFAAALVLSLCAVGLSTYAAYSGASRSIESAREDMSRDDGVFIFTEPAATVNAERTDIPKEPDAQIADETSSAAVPADIIAGGEETGLFFKPAKTMPIADAKVINPYSGGELVKSETLGVWKTHDGADLAAPLGTAVSSMMKGTVTEVKNDPLWGVCVVIDHGDNVIGHYCGLDGNVAVKAGQEVSMGELIGQVGTTADAECKLEPHLHFGVTVGGAWTDPIKFVES